VAELAEEVQQLVRKRVGQTVFNKAHTAVRTRVVELRQSRKKARKLEAVMHPERAAKRRQQQHANKVGNI